MFQVYKISSNRTPYVYYGYTQERDVGEEFIKSIRASRSRGNSMWMEENGGKEDFDVEIFLETADEFDAWVARNDLRSSDMSSITGPTVMPCHLHDKASVERKEQFDKWSKAREIQNCKTAREAYALKAWTFKQIASLSIKHSKHQVVSDLDNLTPSQFHVKYFPVD